MNEFDVIVIGAGPGGTTAAVFLQQAGQRTVILDRGQQPGTHLPESWLYQQQAIFSELGVQNIHQAFLDKSSVRFLSASGTEGLHITLEHIGRADQALPVRLDRNKFDQILVDNAIRHGVQYAPQHMVTGVELVDGSNATITCKTPAGETRYTAPFVIDASGKSAILANQIGLKGKVKKLDARVAVFSHFVDCADSGLNQINTMSIVSIDGGYIFIIPITAERVSVGVVIGEAQASQYGGNLRLLFETELHRSPVVSRFLQGAQQVLPVIPALNHAYECTTVAGPGYMLVGDAAAFLDPFYCNGIDIAMESGKLAGSTAAKLLQSTSFEEHRELAELYDRAFHDLLRTKTMAVYESFGEGITRQFLTSIADPHLPTVLPISLAMQYFLRTAATTPNLNCPETVIQAARAEFTLL